MKSAIIAFTVLVSQFSFAASNSSAPRREAAQKPSCHAQKIACSTPLCGDTNPSRTVATSASGKTRSGHQ